MAGKPKTIWSPAIVTYLRDEYEPDLDEGCLYHKRDNKHHWKAGDKQVTHVDAHGYVGFNVTVGRKRMRLKMHQVIMFFVLGHQSYAVLIDHRDGNRQNNAQSNLREATDQENALNRIDNTFGGQFKAVAHKHQGDWILYQIIGKSGRKKYIKRGFISAGVSFAYAATLGVVRNGSNVRLT